MSVHGKKATRRRFQFLLCRVLQHVSPTPRRIANSTKEKGDSMRFFPVCVFDYTHTQSCSHFSELLTDPIRPGIHITSGTTAAHRLAHIPTGGRIRSRKFNVRIACHDSLTCVCVRAHTAHCMRHESSMAFEPKRLLRGIRDHLAESCMRILAEWHNPVRFRATMMARNEESVVKKMASTKVTLVQLMAEQDEQQQ